MFVMIIHTLSVGGTSAPQVTLKMSEKNMSMLLPNEPLGSDVETWSSSLP